MSQSSEVDKKMFIFGEPIKTQFGNVRFLTYLEFLKYSPELNAISMNSLHIYYYFKSQVDLLPVKDRKELMNEIESLKTTKLREIVLDTDTILKAYIDIFELVLEEENHKRIEEIIDSEEVFMSMRQLIMDMNYINEEPVSTNPEIQEYYDERRKKQQRDSGKQEVSDIVTSIVAGTSKSFEDIKNWTVIQVFAMYYRIGAFKNYDTQTLFASVGSDVKIESWSKNIDLFEKEQLGIGYEAFNQKYGGLFD